MSARANAGLSAPAGAWTVPSRRDAGVAQTTPGDRSWIRLATFTALAAYGVQRWATLISPSPGWRLFGVLAIAVAMAGGVPLLARRNRVLAAALALLLALVAFPVSGLPWEWFHHVRVEVSANWIATGLQGLPDALVPYLGHSPAVRMVIVLGAAVLALDGAAVLAFAGRDGSGPGDGRRAAAALPLTALAIVPCTLIRPQLPYLQGLVLFALLAAFMWADRVRRETAAAAVVLLAVVGVGGALVAPRIDQGRAWVNYRAWAGDSARAHLDRFDWNQTYGPLRWPRSGHRVLEVRAPRPEYWKAEDLDYFDGRAWVAGPGPQQTAPPPGLPDPSLKWMRKWTETAHVTILGMQTRDVIAGGVASQPWQIQGGVAEGTDPGSWVAARALGPGSTYDVPFYSPHPTRHQLRHAGRRYPVSLLGDYLTLMIPGSSAAALGSSQQVVFSPFHSDSPPVDVQGEGLDATRLILDSPYRRAYLLAQRLQARTRTPYGFVQAVQHYVSDATYNEDPPRSRWPLETFLFDRRTGYCQQFSGAMALLLRMGGVPARVASGFTPGTFDRTADRWVVADFDAHAWVEAWFPRYGWVRFDPTPTSAPARSGASGPTILKRSLAGIRGQSLGHRRASVSGAAGSGATPRAAGGGSDWPIWLLAALALVAIGWPLARVVVASSGGADPLAELERAWARTRRPLQADATLAALERQLGESTEAAGYVRALRLGRYGSGGNGPSVAQRRALRRELASGLGWAGALRALWALPPWLPAHRSRHAPATNPGGAP